MNTRSRSLFVAVFVGLLCHIATAQNNCFDTEVQNREWFAQYSATDIRNPNNVKVKVYKSDKMEVYGYSTSGRDGSPISPSTATCDSTSVSDLDPLFYSLVTVGAKQKCIEIFKTDEFSLAHTVDATVSGVSNCPTDVSDDNQAGTGSSAINVKYPFDFANGDCGEIPIREYHAEVYRVDGTDCKGANSKVTASNSAFEMATCAAGNIYEKPFSSTNLKCVGTASPVALGAGQDQGTMLILAWENLNYPGSYSFYCAFFRKNETYPDGVPRIVISIDVTDIQEPKCRFVGKDDVLKGFERVGEINSANYVKLILKPNDCDKGVCLNDGNCTQFMESYTCDCPIGFTGTRCETNIDDCASSPCMNGGTCVDATNEYTCVCLESYTGVHCEDPICLLPEELAGSWYAGVAGLPLTPANAYQLDITEGQDLMKYWKKDDVTKYYTYETECDPGVFGDKWNIIAMTYHAWDSGAGSQEGADKYMCMKFYLPDYTEAQALLFYKKATPSGFLTPSPPNPRPEVQCQGETYTNDVYAMWRVGGATTINCPFTAGRYFLTYQNEANLEQCADADTSKSTVETDTLSFDSCGSEATTTQATFAQTSAATTWKCVADYESEEVFQTANGIGRVLVVRNTDSNLLACLRYMENGRIVEMAMYPTDSVENDEGVPYQAICRYNMNYNSKGTDVVYVKMNSNECRENNFAFPLIGPCQNGGTCTPSMQSWQCTCPAGFTGNTCQTDINECASLPCQNGGTCNDQVNMYSCSCMEGYSGTHCELFDECTSTPCQNGGTCIEQGLDARNNYRCQCVPGYTGVVCESEINECLSMPCQKGGTCTDQINGFICTCPPGTTGTFCQIDINECASLPCQNGGTCRDRIDGYYCFCTDMYIGVHCEHFNECHSNPCQNGGTCVDDLNHYKCDCPGGLTGVNCETEYQTCSGQGELPCMNGATCVPQAIGYTCRCPSNQWWGVNCQWRDSCLVNPCMNAGTCVRNGDAYVCSCTTDWTGTTCQTEYTTGDGVITGETQLDTITLIIIIIAVVVTICVICAIIFFACRHHMATKAAVYSNTGRSMNPALFNSYKEGPKF